MAHTRTAIKSKYKHSLHTSNHSQRIDKCKILSKKKTAWTRKRTATNSHIKLISHGPGVYTPTYKRFLGLPFMLSVAISYCDCSRWGNQQRLAAKEVTKKLEHTHKVIIYLKCHQFPSSCITASLYQETRPASSAKTGTYSQLYIQI